MSRAKRCFEIGLGNPNAKSEQVRVLVNWLGTGKRFLISNEFKILFAQEISCTEFFVSPKLYQAMSVRVPHKERNIQEGERPPNKHTDSAVLGEGRERRSLRSEDLMQNFCL